MNIKRKWSTIRDLRFPYHTSKLIRSHIFNTVFHFWFPYHTFKLIRSHLFIIVFHCFDDFLSFLQRIWFRKSRSSKFICKSLTSVLWIRGQNRCQQRNLFTILCWYLHVYHDLQIQTFEKEKKARTHCSSKETTGPEKP